MLDDRTFNAKFYTVIDIFKQWMPRNYPFASSSILDFGCEFGVMSLAMALRLAPRRVVGVDINAFHEELIDMVRDKIYLKSIPENLEFYQIDPVEELSHRFQFDVIFSWSTFEHVNQPNLGEVVNELYNCLSPDGYVFAQIAPLYYSAFGSHLETLINQPWAHLLMQNNLLRHDVLTAPKVGVYQNEDDHNYEAIKSSVLSCYETLNKITADDLIEVFEARGFKTVKQQRTECVPDPPERLTRVFSLEVLKTEQIVALFQKCK